MDEIKEIVYLPNEGEAPMAFLKRVVAEQFDREPLRIVVQLLEITLGELRGRTCEVSVTASKQCFTLTIRHGGKPIDNRMIWLMDDHIDRAKYKSDGNDWVLTLRRDIPSFYISPEED